MCIRDSSVGVFGVAIACARLGFADDYVKVAQRRSLGLRGRTKLIVTILIAGTASLLICIFLSPKFISFLREREFGQNIREEGPEGHHAKAGTPTMGGIIIFTAIAVPFVLLTDFDDWMAIGVFGVAVACALLGFADDFTKLVKRRSLGLRGRTKLVATSQSPAAIRIVTISFVRPRRPSERRWATFT